LEETVLTRLMVDPAVLVFSPVIDRRVRMTSGETVRLLGVDPFLDQKIRPQLALSRPAENFPQGGDPLAFLLEENAILVDEKLAAQSRLPGNHLFETSRGTFKIVGSFPNPSGEPLILMDISHAQRLFEVSGKIDRVDLIVTDDADFRSRWEFGYRIQSGNQRQATLRDMLQAFRLNLQALSLLALFVGIFLVYNTAMFTVASRRRDAGI
jgi:putative ABC transport system permease protein